MHASCANITLEVEILLTLPELNHRYAPRCDIIISPMVPQITGVSSVCSSVCSGADQRNYQSCVSLAFVRVIHRSPVNSPHKRPKGQERGKCFHMMTSSCRAMLDTCREVGTYWFLPIWFARILTSIFSYIICVLSFPILSRLMLYYLIPGREGGARAVLPAGKYQWEIGRGGRSHICTGKLQKSYSPNPGVIWTPRYHSLKNTFWTLIAKCWVQWYPQQQGSHITGNSVATK